MIDKVGSKITLIASLLALAILSVAVGGFRLGLDLQGGTRMEYRIPFEDAVASGAITEAEAANPQQLIAQICQIFRDRLDPTGVREPLVRAEGTDRIVIELPGTDSEARSDVRATLASDVTDGNSILQLTGDLEMISQFPTTGGTIELGAEKAYFMRRDGDLLRDVTRGVSTESSAHTAGTEVRLINADPWRTLIENVGNLNFYIRATAADFEGQTDLTRERNRVQAWITSNPGADIEDYNQLAYTGDDTGGPWTRLRWYPHADDGRPLEQRIEPLILEKDERWRFDGNDLQPPYVSSDRMGYPAVGFEMKGTAKARFTDFTREHQGEPMAIVMNDEIATMPTIQQTLPGQGIINGGAGGFTMEEVTDLVTVLRSGSLKIRPVLEHQERVGASLGSKYVQLGALSAALGLVFVLAFILVFYKRLGLFAALSLVANLTMLMGALAFLQATLTLPGVAGIILTVGMAVDANILIFERIREEAARGRKPIQAAKDGFGNALSTIVDANLTTLITAIILYNAGSGPVRGFATTLSVGILTSMFAALVITRVFVHLQLEKGVSGWDMRKIVDKTDIAFLSKAKLFVPVSVIAVVVGLGTFIAIPDKTKLGIDFLGGVTMTVRTEQPQPTEGIRDRVRTIPGIIGSSSEIKAVQSTASGDGFTQFRITFKTPGAENQTQDQQSVKDTVEFEIRQVLADVLQAGPYEIRVDEDTDQVNGALYFEEVHPEDEIVTLLEAASVQSPTIARIDGPPAAWSFSGTVGTADTEQAVRDRIAKGFDGEEDSNSRTFAWSSPVPEVAVVGAQVVSELRDKAILAVLLSLFAAVLYIRFRFAEYSFGLAAVIALVHDVSITLGLLGLVQLSGIIEAEINLPMIAAFLTIIGYSLNDTIVVFDRVRENQRRLKGSLEEIVNTSVNQTLSRTLLTSLTTLISVVLLLAFNFGSRNVLEGFAFALMIGVLVGTYSSIFIASPALVWLEKKRLAREGELVEEEASSASTATS